MISRGKTIRWILLLPPVTAMAGAPEPLTFDAAWQRVLAATPEAAVLAGEREAVAGEAEQAHRLPNPELSADIENVLGTRPLRGVDAGEMTVQIRQTYVRAEKRAVRRHFAESAFPVAEAEWAVRIANLRQRTAAAFLTVQTAQARAGLRREAVELARRTVDTVRRQHEAGQASGIDLSRAGVELNSAQVGLDAAESAVTQGRRALAVLWGAPEADFSGVSGELDVATTLPDLHALETAIESAPDLQLLAAEAGRRELALKFARSEPARDLGLAGGIRYFRDGSDAAFVVGVSIPLLVHDRNQGAIRAARARLQQAPHQAAAVRLARRSELAGAYADLASAQHEAAALARDVLPAANEVVRQNEEALAQGRVTLLQVLDAQRTLLDARERRLDAVGRHLQARVVLDRLTLPVAPPPNQAP